MTGGRPDAASEIVAAIHRVLPSDPRLGDLVEVLGARAGGILLAVVVFPSPEFRLALRSALSSPSSLGAWRSLDRSLGFRGGLAEFALGRRWSLC